MLVQIADETFTKGPCRERAIAFSNDCISSHISRAPAKTAVQGGGRCEVRPRRLTLPPPPTVPFPHFLVNGVCGIPLGMTVIRELLDEVDSVAERLQAIRYKLSRLDRPAEKSKRRPHLKSGEG